MLLLSLLCVSMVAFLTAHTVVLWKLTRIVVMFDERLDRMEHVRRWGGAEECAPRFVVSNGAVPADLKPEEIRVKGVADRVVPRREDVRVEGRGAEAETY
ncbi:hypothetical protein HK104_006941 [Borealophlyctis nickersoniae]|nr:hypothetical protein HK104_006941 [Borealophlyctis nickersoniae]